MPKNLWGVGNRQFLGVFEFTLIYPANKFICSLIRLIQEVKRFLSDFIVVILNRAD